MRKLRQSLTLSTLLFLNSCQVKTVSECPIDIPEAWRNPQKMNYYPEVSMGFMDCGDKRCMTVDDAQTMLKKMAVCESIRKGLIDFIDDVNMH